MTTDHDERKAGKDARGPHSPLPRQRGKRRGWGPDGRTPVPTHQLAAPPSPRRARMPADHVSPLPPQRGRGRGWGPDGRTPVPTHQLAAPPSPRRARMPADHNSSLPRRDGARNVDFAPPGTAGVPPARGLSCREVVRATRRPEGWGRTKHASGDTLPSVVGGAEPGERAGEGAGAPSGARANAIRGARSKCLPTTPSERRATMPADHTPLSRASGGGAGGGGQTDHDDREAGKDARGPRLPSPAPAGEGQGVGARRTNACAGTPTCGTALAKAGKDARGPRLPAPMNTSPVDGARR